MVRHERSGEGGELSPPKELPPVRRPIDLLIVRHADADDKTDPDAPITGKGEKQVAQFAVDIYDYVRENYPNGAVIRNGFHGGITRIEQSGRNFDQAFRVQMENRERGRIIYEGNMVLSPALNPIVHAYNSQEYLDLKRGVLSKNEALAAWLRKPENILRCTHGVGRLIEETDKLSTNLGRIHGDHPPRLHIAWTSDISHLTLLLLFRQISPGDLVRRDDKPACEIANTEVMRVRFGAPDGTIRYQFRDRQFIQEPYRKIAQ